MRSCRGGGALCHVEEAAWVIRAAPRTARRLKRLGACAAKRSSLRTVLSLVLKGMHWSAEVESGKPTETVGGEDSWVESGTDRACKGAVCERGI